MSTPGTSLHFSACLSFILATATALEQQQHVSPLAGEVVVLPCSTNSSTIEWLYQPVWKIHRPLRVSSNRNVLNGFRDRFTVESAMTGQYDLVINGARLNDSGLYKCRGTDDNVIVSIQLYVFDEQLYGQETLTESAFVGDTVQLPCETENSLGVVWRYQKSPESRPVKVAESHFDMICINGYRGRCTVEETEGDRLTTLVLRGVTENDTGVYTCVHDAGQGKRTSIRLNVFRTSSEDPKIEKACFAGESVVLPCKTSVASATSWWYQRSPDAQRRQVTLRGLLNANYADRFVVETALPGDHSIRIRRTDVNDDGLYTCVEDVGLGNARTTSVKLAVKDRTADNDRPSYKEPTEKATQQPNKDTNHNGIPIGEQKPAERAKEANNGLTFMTIAIAFFVISMVVMLIGIVAFCCRLKIAELTRRDCVCCTCCSWNNSSNAASGEPVAVHEKLMPI